MSTVLPILYTELAPWFHLLTAPEDYAEESAFYMGVIAEALGGMPRSLLELGSGGGNMASHYKQQAPDVVLTDLSAEMLALSRTINPELEHIQGDMRTVRVNRTFDAVFVQDAIVYLTTEADLKQAMETAFLHLRPGGVAVFAPDHVTENFHDSTDHGGHDGNGRSLRYLEWMTDPDPADTTYRVEYTYMLREGNGPARAVLDTHIEGLFPRATWARLLHEAGFRTVSSRPLIHSEVPEGAAEIFVAIRL